mmetsp:Transcript_15577/g.24810  ORF Transcript_15577/g.24810 Transcript_15577/m.24810 type:complete len:732 (+) Transcript_15577:48-2243(+)
MFPVVPRFGISAWFPHARKLSALVGNSLKAQRPPKSRFLKARFEEKTLGGDSIQSTPTLPSVAYTEAPKISSIDDSNLSSSYATAPSKHMDNAEFPPPPPLPSTFRSNSEDASFGSSLPTASFSSALPPPPPLPSGPLNDGATSSTYTTKTFSPTLDSSSRNAQASSPLADLPMPPLPPPPTQSTASSFSGRVPDAPLHSMPPPISSSLLGTAASKAASPSAASSAPPPFPPPPTMDSTPAPKPFQHPTASGFPPPPPILDTPSTSGRAGGLGNSSSQYAPSSELPSSPLGAFPPPPPLPNVTSTPAITSPPSAATHNLPSSPVNAAFPPPPSAPSHAATSQVPTSTSPVSTPARPLTAQEQYEKLKHFLPMSKAPDTPKPKPEELHVGMKLRVEWKGTWWAAKVKEATDTHVRISFDTWSSNYDEVMPRDCDRFHLRPPGDKDADEEDAARNAAYPTGVETFPTFSGRQRPFVPKPYNPEKEFQKRQLRLREKIASMQRSKLGNVDSSLESLKTLKMPSFAPSMPSSSSSSAQVVSTPSQPVSPNVEASPPLPPLPPAATSSHAPPSNASVSPSSRGLVVPVVPADSTKEVAAPPLPAEVELPAPPSNSPVSPGFLAPPAAAVSAKEVLPPAADGKPASTTSGSPSVSAGVESTKEVTSVASPPETPSGRGSVKWEEVLTESKERYYHELATGRTQWELPADGWIELIAEDGAPYYWEPSSNTTQWSIPP